MELSHIRAFLVLAEELHFGRTAARLHISQPPLSRQIQQLEEEVGAPLFERTSRSVRITPAGMAFRREAKVMMARGEAAILAARAAVGEKSGTIKLGFVGAATYSYLPFLSRILSDRFPNLTIRFQEATSVSQLEALAVGRLDLGLMRPIEGVEIYENMTVAREELIVAIPISHPLAGRRHFDIGQLDDEPLIGFSPDAPYLRTAVGNICRHIGIRPRVVQEFAQSQAILSLVSAGLGLALVPQSTANASFDSVTFRPLRINGRALRNSAIELLAVWKKHTENPARQAVLDLLPHLKAELAMSATSML